MEVDLEALLRSGRLPLAMLAAVVVLVLAGLISYVTSIRRGKTVLFVGPSGAGKTSLFLQIKDGCQHNGTVPSMQENEERVELKVPTGHRTRLVDIVDVPGHPRVRGRFAEHIDSACGLVLVVDSADFLPHKAEIAEQLLEVLNHPAMLKRRLPLLIACNKADLGAKAHSAEFVKKRLEKEIDVLRGTRASMLDTHDKTERDILGKRTESFTFDALGKARGVVVTAASMSVVAADIEVVLRFMRTCAG